MSPRPTGAAIKPIADGVGVMGGIDFVARILLGVDGDAAPLSEEDATSVTGLFRFLEMMAIFSGLDDFTGIAFSLTSREAAAAPIRAERLDDIVDQIGRNAEQKVANTRLRARVGTVRRCSLMADARVVFEYLREVPTID
jgi:hypothetical protein